jgi:25S rRNA (uracil2843-N3)-methyltransferase
MKPMLLTLLFTLNELYTTSIGKTTAFLLKLTMAVKPGSLLLVVDSPGSYSETKLGSEAKKYPMSWLMDHTLLEPEDSQEGPKGGKNESPASWVKIVSEEAKWFRIPEELRYPIPLENMRYQMHLYRRV